MRLGSPDTVAGPRAWPGAARHRRVRRSSCSESRPTRSCARLPLPFHPLARAPTGIPLFRCYYLYPSTTGDSRQDRTAITTRSRQNRATRALRPA